MDGLSRTINPFYSTRLPSRIQRRNSQRFNFVYQLIEGELGARGSNSRFCKFNLVFGWWASHNPEPIALIINQFNLTLGAANLAGNISL